MAETERLAMTGAGRRARDEGRSKMGGRGSRRAETTAIGDWQTACWSGYQPR